MTGHAYSSARTLFQPSPTCRPHDICFVYSQTLFYFVSKPRLFHFHSSFFLAFYVNFTFRKFAEDSVFPVFHVCASGLCTFPVDTMPTEFAIQHISLSIEAVWKLFSSVFWRKCEEFLTFVFRFCPEQFFELFRAGVFAK